MSRKIPIDIAGRIAGLNPNDSIYAKENKYGYKINVNNPKIRPLYELFKEKTEAVILSDKQRFYFEYLIFQMIKKEKKQ
ncbi:MAG: hypothetical protein NC485_13295 [Ruminococcus flavefaciens]|nr:hypothetical protein [Ruminococcus flavefaciens]